VVVAIDVVLESQTNEEKEALVETWMRYEVAESPASGSL
jgi:hypothetical protein